MFGLEPTPRSHHVLRPLCRDRHDGERGSRGSRAAGLGRGRMEESKEVDQLHEHDGLAFVAWSLSSSHVVVRTFCIWFLRCFVFVFENALWGINMAPVTFTMDMG